MLQSKHATPESSGNSNSLPTSLRERVIQALHVGIDNVRNPLTHESLPVGGSLGPVVALRSAPSVSMRETFRQGIEFAASFGRKSVVSYLAAGTLCEMLPLALVYISSKLPSLAIGVEYNPKALPLLMGAGVGICALRALQAGAQSWRGWVQETCLRSSQRAITERLIMASADLSQPLLEREETQNSLTKLREHQTDLAKFGENLYRVAPQALAVLATAAVVMPIAPAFGAIIAGIGVWTVIQGYQYGREMSLISDITAEEQRKNYYKILPLRESNGLLECKHLAKVRALATRATEDFKEVDDAQLVGQARNVRRTFVNRFCTALTVGAASMYGIASFVGGSLSLESALLLGAATTLFTTSVDGLSSTLGELARSFDYMREACALFATGRETSHRETDLAPEQTPRWLEAPRIELKNVSVVVPAYDREDPKRIVPRVLLENISLDIQPGQLVGIVGPPGAGKTTLSKLLLGALEPACGTVLINGESIESLPLGELRANTSFLPQLYWNYPGRTLAENIRLGVSVWGAAMSVEAVSEISGLAQLMKANGFSLNTVSGPDFKNGRLLSGGEHQLVALTRALMKQGRMIVLDEPTSRLDPATSERFLSHLRQLQGTTRVLISHDMGLVSRCDRIVVVNRAPGAENGPGGIEAVGTHEELLLRSPTYAEFYGVQAGRFSNGRPSATEDAAPRA